MPPTWALCLLCSPLGVALGVGAGLATLEPANVRVMPPLPPPPPYVAPTVTPTQAPVVRVRARPAVAPADLREDSGTEVDRPGPAEPAPTLTGADEVDGHDEQGGERGEGGEPQCEAPPAPEGGEDEDEDPAEGGEPADDVVADECAAAEPE